MPDQSSDIPGNSSSQVKGDTSDPTQTARTRLASDKQSSSIAADPESEPLATKIPASPTGSTTLNKSTQTSPATKQSSKNPRRTKKPGRNREPGRTVMSGKEFVAALIDEGPKNSFRILDIILAAKTEGDIVVFQNETKKYVLERSFAVLRHKDVIGTGNDYHNLISRDDHGKIQRISVGGSMKPSVFLALGWLVEKTKTSNSVLDKCTTNYVVLWNISTNPSSLWIVYDYDSIHDDGEFRLNELGGEKYHNSLFYNEDYKPARAMKDNFGAAKKAFSKAKDGHVKVALIRNKSSESLHLQDRTSGLSGFGFLGIDAPFDVAMLTPNFEEWNAEAGLDAGLVELTLAYSHVFVGDTLRAKTVDGPGKSTVAIGGWAPVEI